MNVLVIFKCLGPLGNLKKSVRNHLECLKYASDVKVFYWNVAVGNGKFLGKYSFDLIVLHSTLLSARYGDQAVFRYWRNQLSWIGRHPSIKVALPQDERFYSEVLSSWLTELGVSKVFSIFGDDKSKIDKIYAKMDDGVLFEQVLTGYIDDDLVDFESPIKWKDRKIDLLYRAKRLPLWVGRFGKLKTKIDEELKKIALSNVDLNIDSSVELQDMLLGDDWIKALCDSKYIVGCEAGGTAIDRSGELSSFILELQEKSQGKLSDETLIEAVADKFGLDWDAEDFKTLGPRNLEAILTRTCQILVIGDYAGVLKPYRHYIPIEHDLSNIDEVLSLLSDEVGCKIVENAYNDLVLNSPHLRYSYLAERVLLPLRDSEKSERFTMHRWVSKFLSICLLLGFYVQIPNLVRLKFISRYHP